MRSNQHQEMTGVMLLIPSYKGLYKYVRADTLQTLLVQDRPVFSLACARKENLQSFLLCALHLLYIHRTCYDTMTYNVPDESKS